MPEFYPDDATLLSMSEDSVTGVEMIPTGRSPYVLEFRKLVQRLLLAAGRANDLRVYQDGDLSVGIRAGRCFVGDQARWFAGVEGRAVSPNATTHLWLDAGGQVQSSTGALPTDRTIFIPLANVTAGGAITQIADLRGESFLMAPSLASLGVTASASRINAALSNAASTVTAANLNQLTAGNTANADYLHRHLIVYQNETGEAYFTLINGSANPDANVGLVLSLPGRFPDDLVLLPDAQTGFLTQRYDNRTFGMIGVCTLQASFAGEVTDGVNPRFLGVAPQDGVITDVVLSVRLNLQSNHAGDAIAALVRRNGELVASTPPSLSSAAGTGFRSTAQGHGTPAAIVSGSIAQVRRGDVFTVDLNRTVGGTLSQEATDVAVLVVIRAAGPD